MDILDDMGVTKLSAKVFFCLFKVNYSFNINRHYNSPLIIGKILERLHYLLVFIGFFFKIGKSF